MNDDFEGGETVFSGGPVLNFFDNKTYAETIKERRAANQIDALKEGSWEERLSGICYSNMRVRPLKSRALFFYNQLPNGTMDVSSIHGACPILGGGAKWSANIWMWSAPRRGYEHAPYRRGEQKPDVVEPKDKESYTRFSVWFYNTGRTRNLTAHNCTGIIAILQNWEQENPLKLVPLLGTFGISKIGKATDSILGKSERTSKTVSSFKYN